VAVFLGSLLQTLLNLGDGGLEIAGNFQMTQQLTVSPASNT